MRRSKDPHDKFGVLAAVPACVQVCGKQPWRTRYCLHKKGFVKKK